MRRTYRLSHINEARAAQEERMSLGILKPWCPFHVNVDDTHSVCTPASRTTFLCTLLLSVTEDWCWVFSLWTDVLITVFWAEKHRQRRYNRSRSSGRMVGLCLNLTRNNSLHGDGRECAGLTFLLPPLSYLFRKQQLSMEYKQSNIKLQSRKRVWGL